MLIDDVLKEIIETEKFCRQELEKAKTEAEKVVLDATMNVDVISNNAQDKIKIIRTTNQNISDKNLEKFLVAVSEKIKRETDAKEQELCKQIDNESENILKGILEEWQS